MANESPQQVQLPADESKKIDALMKSGADGVQIDVYMFNENVPERDAFLRAMAEYEQGQLKFENVVDLMKGKISVVLRTLSATEREVNSWDPKHKAAKDKFFEFKKQFVKFMEEYRKYEIANRSAGGRAVLSAMNSFMPFVFKDVPQASAVDKVNEQLKSTYHYKVNSLYNKYGVAGEGDWSGSSLVGNLDGVQFLSVKNDKWKEFFVKSILNNKAYVEKEGADFKEKALARINVPGVDLIQELIDLDANFHKSFDKVEKRVQDKIKEWEDKIATLESRDYFENFKAIYDIRDNYEANSYLKFHVFKNIENALSKMDKESDWYKHFKPQYDDMVEKYIGESGMLGDTGYSFYFPMGVLLESAGQVIEGKMKKSEIFQHVPTANLLAWESGEPKGGEEGVSKGSLDEIVDNQRFQQYNTVSGLLAQIIGEAQDLQYRMAQAGIDAPVPDGFDLYGYMAAYKGKTLVVEQMYKAAKLNMSDLRAQLNKGGIGTVKSFLQSLPKEFTGKDAAKHEAERKALQALVDKSPDTTKKWTDPVTGIFAAGKKLEPLQATYLAMQALDDMALVAPILERAADFHARLSADEDGEFNGVAVNNGHNADFFKLLFPKWAYNNAISPAAGASGVSETVRQAPGK